MKIIEIHQDTVLQWSNTNKIHACFGCYCDTMVKYAQTRMLCVLLSSQEMFGFGEGLQSLSFCSVPEALACNFTKTASIIHQQGICIQQEPRSAGRKFHAASRVSN